MELWMNANIYPETSGSISSFSIHYPAFLFHFYVRGIQLGNLSRNKLPFQWSQQIFIDISRAEYQSESYKKKGWNDNYSDNDVVYSDVVN